MDVLNVFVQNSALNGMPKWYKATTLLLFAFILAIIAVSFFILITQGSDMNIRYGY
ncbi:hypothetical protein [Maribacter sp. 2-571]|uniref:hypothetical protein n=1 Tax=Maribacter sp. 2-571 TaxID=3417569 RepID=UPI003D33B7B0